MVKDTLTAISSRYACRSYSAKKVPIEVLRQIAAAGVAAPSAVNRQPWRIIVVTDASLLADMDAAALENLKVAGGYDWIVSRGGKVFYDAPAMILIVGKLNDEGTLDAGVALDCGFVAENVALAATALGVDNVICGMARAVFSGAKAADFAQRLGIPTGYGFAISILLGYASTPGGTPHEPDLTKITYV